MSPKSRGRPPGRGRAKKKPSPKKPASRSPEAPPTFESRALHQATLLLRPEASALHAEALASQLLGESWVLAELGERTPEATAVAALVARVRRSPTPAGAALLAACALVASEQADELHAVLDELDLPLPEWAGAAVPEPTGAWRAEDPWASSTQWLIVYDEPVPHLLVAAATHPGGVEVMELEVIDPDGLTDFDEVFGPDAPVPMPRTPVPVGAALAGLRDALLATDLLWPRDDRTTEYIGGRLLAWRRVRAHADPVPSVDELLAVDRLPAEDRARLADRFLADRPDADETTRYLVDLLLSYGDGYLPEPLAWSPADVELFLLDYVPRKVVLEPAERAALPALLKEWVRFALAERGTGQRWIAPVVEAVNRFGAEFTDARDDESTYGPAEQLAAWLAEQGVDLDDRAAVDAAVSEHNAVLLARRALTTDRSALPPGAALRVTVRLRDVHPRVWRRVVVPADITLDLLHDVVQQAMGWEDEHPHEWQLDDQRFAWEGGSGARPERGVRLVDLLGAGQSIDYLYDFGDGWSHEVMLNEILPPPDAGQVPRCEAGGRACPLEDIGGPPRYDALRQALADPNGAPDWAVDLAEQLEGFDPDAFDPRRVSAVLEALLR